MTWILLSIAVCALAFAAVMRLRRLRRRRSRSSPDRRVDNKKRPSKALLSIELSPRIDEIASTIIDAQPWRPAAQPGVPSAAPAIEYALMSGDPRRALELAEAALAEEPESARTQLYLAWALCANAQPGAALLQVDRARAADKSLETDAFRLYLACRAEHLQFEHGVGAMDACPPLVTPADLSALSLASGHVPTAQLVEYRDATARALVRAIGAVERAPGFVDAAYLVARLAIKSGHVDAGRALFEAIAPLMAGRPDAKSFERDHEQLPDAILAVAAAKTAAPTRRTRGFTAPPA